MTPETTSEDAPSPGSKAVQQQNQSVRLKVVIRKLPPNLPEDVFLGTLQPWVKRYDYCCYVQGKQTASRAKNDKCSRAYVRFMDAASLVEFHKQYNGHQFISSEGKESRALVEFAPYQKIPKQSKGKPDTRKGTLEQDPDFQSFVESLKASVQAPIASEQIKGYYFPISNESANKPQEASSQNKVTPLIEYLRSQKAAAAAKAKIQREKTSGQKQKAQEEKKASAQKLADATLPKVAANKERAVANKATQEHAVKPAALGENAAPSKPKSKKASKAAKGDAATTVSLSNSVSVPKGPKSFTTSTNACGTGGATSQERGKSERGRGRGRGGGRGAAIGARNTTPHSETFKPVVTPQILQAARPS